MGWFNFCWVVWQSAFGGVAIDDAWIDFVTGVAIASAHALDERRYRRQFGDEHVGIQVQAHFTDLSREGDDPTG